MNDVIDTKTHAELISVLIPATSNGEQTEAVCLEAIAVLEQLDLDFEVVYLIEDDQQASLESAQAAQVKFPDQIRILRFGKNVGESAMLRAGIEKSAGDIVVTLPDSFSVDLAAIGQLVDAVREGVDLAFAARTSSGDRRLQSKLFNRLVALASGTHYRDIASGTRAFRRSLGEETPFYGDFHRYLPILAERLGFQVREIESPIHGKSPASTVLSPRLYLWRAIDVLSVMFVTRFTRYPLRLFGGVGAAFAGAGVLMLTVLVVQRTMGTPLANRPALVLGILLVGLGVQTFSIGLLGELILFFRARRIRDYRVAGVFESSPPRIPERPSGESGESVTHAD